MLTGELEKALMHLQKGREKAETSVWGRTYEAVPETLRPRAAYREKESDRKVKELRPQGRQIRGRGGDRRAWHFLERLNPCPACGGGKSTGRRRKRNGEGRPASSFADKEVSSCLC